MKRMTAYLISLCLFATCILPARAAEAGIIVPQDEVRKETGADAGQNGKTNDDMGMIGCQPDSGNDAGSGHQSDSGRSAGCGYHPFPCRNIRSADKSFPCGKSVGGECSFGNTFRESAGADKPFPCGKPGGGEYAFGNPDGAGKPFANGNAGYGKAVIGG